MKPSMRMRRHPHGLTLVVILSIVAVAAGAGRTHQYVNHETDAISQVENACRRILRPTAQVA